MKCHFRVKYKSKLDKTPPHTTYIQRHSGAQAGTAGLLFLLCCKTVMAQSPWQRSWQAFKTCFFVFVLLCCCEGMNLKSPVC